MYVCVWRGERGAWGRVYDALMWSRIARLFLARVSLATRVEGVSHSQTLSGESLTCHESGGGLA